MDGIRLVRSDGTPDRAWTRLRGRRGEGAAGQTSQPPQQETTNGLKRRSVQPWTVNRFVTSPNLCLSSSRVQSLQFPLVPSSLGLIHVLRPSPLFCLIPRSSISLGRTCKREWLPGDCTVDTFPFSSPPKHLDPNRWNFCHLTRSHW
jgi:hypothetical protein